MGAGTDGTQSDTGRIAGRGAFGADANAFGGVLGGVGTGAVTIYGPTGIIAPGYLLNAPNGGDMPLVLANQEGFVIRTTHAGPASLYTLGHRLKSMAPSRIVTFGGFHACIGGDASTSTIGCPASRYSRARPEPLASTLPSATRPRRTVVTDVAENRVPTAHRLQCTCSANSVLMRWPIARSSVSRNRLPGGDVRSVIAELQRQAVQTARAMLGEMLL